MPTGELPYDVFLSHSAKDKAVVRDVAERLKKDGVQKASQLSTLTSPLPGGSDWAQWESWNPDAKNVRGSHLRAMPCRGSLPAL